MDIMAIEIFGVTILDLIIVSIAVIAFIMILQYILDLSRGRELHERAGMFDQLFGGGGR